MSILKKHWLKIVGVIALVILGLIGWEYLASGIAALLSFFGLKLNKKLNSNPITITNPRKAQDEKDADALDRANDSFSD